MADGIGIKYIGKTTAFVPDAITCEEFTGKPGPISATFTAGSQVPISWNVTLAHDSDPGVSVWIQYAPTEPFTMLKEKVNVNDLKTTVTLPADKTSENAVLRYSWQSTTDGGYYLGCADVKVVSALVASEGPTGTPPRPSSSSSAAVPAPSSSGAAPRPSSSSSAGAPAPSSSGAAPRPSSSAGAPAPGPSSTAPRPSSSTSASGPAASNSIPGAPRPPSSSSSGAPIPGPSSTGTAPRPSIPPNVPPMAPTAPPTGTTTPSGT
ncbi:hypothetical protein HDV05_002397, partial [Chytridiales sp. JEL 0842]